MDDNDEIPTLEPTTEQLESALRRYRDEQFATWIVSAIWLAAKTHPERVREALASVFDLKEMEKHSGISASKCQAAAEMAGRLTAEVRELVAAIHKDVDRVEQRVDSLKNHLEMMERRLVAGGKT